MYNLCDQDLINRFDHKVQLKHIHEVINIHIKKSSLFNNTL